MDLPELADDLVHVLKNGMLSIFHIRNDFFVFFAQESCSLHIGVGE